MCVCVCAKKFLYRPEEDQAIITTTEKLLYTSHREYMLYEYSILKYRSSLECIWFLLTSMHSLLQNLCVHYTHTAHTHARIMHTCSTFTRFLVLCVVSQLFRSLSFLFGRVHFSDSRPSPNNKSSNSTWPPYMTAFSLVCCCCCCCGCLFSRFSSAKVDWMILFFGHFSHSVVRTPDHCT